MGYKGRDIEISEIDEDNYLVVACDSCGAVGDKEYDLIKVPPSLVGRLTTRVVLMEIISIGAIPKMLSATISCEPSPTGEGILEGVREELKTINMMEMPMVISTEKNFQTKQTGIGITIVGIVSRKKLRIGSSKSEDLVYCLGIPMLGNEIKGAEDIHMVKEEQILELINTSGVHEVLPIGSRGIMEEVVSMAGNVNCEFLLMDNLELDILKSGGPATCLIFSCSPDCELPNFMNIQLNLIGKLN